VHFLMTMNGLGEEPMASLMPSWGIRFAALGWPALRFCAAVVVGIALIVGLIIVWGVAVLVIAVVAHFPQKRSL
jgi:uncharacterized membrane protein YphA (DoxX/SURF4 family)